MFPAIYVRSYTTHIQINNGMLPQVPFCNGPSPSTDKGMDAVCCTNCNALRLYYYDYEGRFVDSDIGIEYMKKLIDMKPKILNGIVVSTCRSMVIHYKPKLSYSEPSLYLKSLWSQCLLMHDLKLVNPNITSENVHQMITCDLDGMPYIIPFDAVRVKTFGDDEGVEFHDDIIEVTDHDAYLESGKWCHLLLYYMVLDRLTGRKNTKRLL